MKHGAVIAEYALAERTPQIQNIVVKFHESSHGNLVRLTWEATADGKANPGLEYGVRFSNDGEKWRPIAASSNEPAVVVDLSLLPGGDGCRFQVVASAGFRTTIQETKTFQASPKPREIHLLSPAEGSEFELGAPISFVATGFSPDFGNAKSDEIFWTTLPDNHIGVGQQFLATDLPVGSHLVTVRVPDGMGNLATKSVQVKVIPRKPSTSCDENVDRSERVFNAWKKGCGCR